MFRSEADSKLLPLCTGAAVGEGRCLGLTDENEATAWTHDGERERRAFPRDGSMDGRQEGLDTSYPQHVLCKLLEFKHNHRDERNPKLAVGLASWLCDLFSYTGLPTQKEPVLGLMLCYHHLEINF